MFQLKRRSFTSCQTQSLLWSFDYGNKNVISGSQLWSSYEVKIIRSATYPESTLNWSNHLIIKSPLVVKMLNSGHGPYDERNALLIGRYSKSCKGQFFWKQQRFKKSLILACGINHNISLSSELDATKLSKLQQFNMTAATVGSSICSEKTWPSWFLPYDELTNQSFSKIMNRMNTNLVCQSW